MNRFVVMVDAGYLLRQSIEVVSNKASTQRAELVIPNVSALIKVILDKSKAILDLADKELLRVYWYDGVMGSGFTQQQKAIVDVDDVQFRAGTINGSGQQKGVDSLIVTDLIELTTHHAICDAVLITGDSDLAIGMTIAQSRGVRVAVLGIEDLAVGVAHHQSFDITSRADRVGRLAGADLRPVLKYVPKVAPPPPVAAVVAPPVAAVAPPPTSVALLAATPPAAQVAVGITAADQAQITASVKAFITQRGASLEGVVDKNTKRIDAGTDKALLHDVFVALGRKMTAAETIFIRQVFRAEV